MVGRSRKDLAVNFDYSEDQQFLKDQARRFLEERCPPKVVRGVLEAPEQGYDRALYQAIAEMGWIGAAVPEAYGGLGLGRVELCALAEELGRALAPTPFASTVYFAIEALLLAGDEAQKSRLLPQLASGATVACFATSEGPGPFDPARLTTRVDGGRITGVKIPVTDGASADLAVVLASEAGAPGLFIVELGADVERELLKTLDPTRPAARLAFRGAACERLGDPGAGGDLAQHVLDRAAVLLAFEQIGGADKCLEEAKAYALERFAFGRVIGSYQAIKHKLADIYLKNQVARSNAYYGAWALNAGAAELPLAAAAARVAASEAFWFAAKENLQTHGGMGFTWDGDCHLYLRRAQQLGLVAGASRVWKERLVSQLERRNAA